ncbi:MAG: glycoside hydrolase family 92 protein [Bacteroidales bacterium]|nr:glycoside hydrolase family 92 protein [Bacteroidales bacterium]
MFYTALYHSSLTPNVQSDVNGDFAVPGSQTTFNLKKRQLLELWFLRQQYLKTRAIKHNCT